MILGVLCAAMVCSGGASFSSATQGSLEKRSLSERTRVLVGTVLSMDTGIPYGDRQPRPRRYTRVTLELSAAHGADAGSVVDVITFASLWANGDELILTRRSHEPVFLVRPGEEVVVRAVQGKYFGEGTALYGAWQVKEFYVVESAVGSLAEGALWTVEASPSPGVRVREHFENTRDIDLSLLEYVTSPAQQTLGQYLERTAEDLGLSPQVLLVSPEGRSNE